MEVLSVFPDEIQHTITLYALDKHSDGRMNFMKELNEKLRLHKVRHHLYTPHTKKQFFSDMLRKNITWDTLEKDVTRGRNYFHLKVGPKARIRHYYFDTDTE